MKLHSFGYLIREGAKSLWKNRTMTIASIAVLLSCLFLMGAAALLSMNLSAVMKSVEGNNTITVYLKDSVPTLKSIQVGEEFRKIENVTECTFKPRSEGFEDVIEILGENGSLLYDMVGSEDFFPDAYTITMGDLSKYEETIAQIKAVDGVENITDYSDIASKLSSLDTLVKYGSLAIVIVLGVISLFIISNTVKVTMFSRRMEINIMKSVGATNGFVRIPFIVEGIIIGMFAGALSACLLFVGYEKLMTVIYGIVPYMKAVDIAPFLWIGLLSYIAIGVLFGILGCGISIGKYLKKEGEEAIV